LVVGVANVDGFLEIALNLVDSGHAERGPVAVRRDWIGLVVSSLD